MNDLCIVDESIWWYMRLVLYELSCISLLNGMSNRCRLNMDAVSVLCR